MAFAVAATAACAGLFLLYLGQSRTAPFNSDGAANVLQAQAIIGGNPLLRGWWTSDVSFYTTELPEYALVTAVRGVTPDVVHVCGALSYTLAVLLAALLAASGAARAAAGRPALDPRVAGCCGAAVAAGIMLAPSILGGSEVFLENPDHAGTAVPLLALLLLLDRAGPRRFLWCPVLLLLVLAQVGDELSLIVATGPLAAVCAARLAAGRLVAGRLATGGERRRDAALITAAVGSVAAAWLTALAIRALGGFDVRSLGGIAPAALRSVPGNARLLWQSLVLLFGANQPGAPRTPQAVAAHPVLAGLADLHIAGLVLAGAGLAAGIAAVAARRADRVTAVLVTAVAVTVTASLFSTLLRSLSNAHEVAVLLPFCAALAGRTLPALPWPGAARAGRPLAVALTCWLAVSLAGLGYAAAWPAAAPPQQAVAGWLAGQHQQEGLAGYWQAAATTVTSGGRVLVAPVVFTTVPAAGARARAGAARGAATPARGAGVPVAQADRWESSAAWYQPGQRTATFVIAVTDPAAPGGGLSTTAVTARFGMPASRHRIGQDVILLYRYNLLTRVRGTSFPAERS